MYICETRVLPVMVVVVQARVGYLEATVSYAKTCRDTMLRYLLWCSFKSIIQECRGIDYV